MIDRLKVAETYAQKAICWMDADIGWQAGMSTDERIARRSADLAHAQALALIDIAESLRTIAEQGPGGVS